MSSKKKVAIVDAYHDSDRGGAGILAGVIDILYDIEKQEESDIEIDVVYRFSDGDSRISDADRHTNVRYRNIQTHGQTISTSWPNKSLVNYLYALKIILTSLVILVLPQLSQRSGVHAIRNADYVISKGGHFYQFQDKNSLRAYFSAYHKLYTLLLTIRLQKPLAIVSHSFGPFNNYAAKLLTRYVLHHASYTSAREIRSLDIIEQLGGNQYNLNADTAFAMNLETDEGAKKVVNENSLTEDEFAIFTARQWDFPKYDRTEVPQLYDNYLSEMAEIADWLVAEEYVTNVALVVHNNGTHQPHEDDSKPINSIYERMSHSDKAVIIDKDLSPQTQSELYGKAKVMIGTRMHSAIFSFVGGAPALAISYTHKTEGIMAMLGLSRYVIQIGTMDTKKAKRRLKEIIKDRESIIEQSSERITTLQKELISDIKLHLSQ
ncbi:polysaccharide pyruvyl transferase family protein [Halobellus rarus]|uniref:Polysaccharide pyruvyl transferase family protein n=1 Tax=Halobellus rarus TaxID=1126237 RepID=A0ABD6CP56_9EURY|nr:polysaccharide pyruvyl transferase family protein [Halobellus rarus]